MGIWLISTRDHAQAFEAENCRPQAFRSTTTSGRDLPVCLVACTFVDEDDSLISDYTPRGVGGVGDWGPRGDSWIIFLELHT